MDNDNFFDYDEMMEEKKARRQALMSDKEIELTEQYLLWYRRGYEDKQRLGLIEKWRDQLADYDIVQPFNQLSLETKDELIEKIPSKTTVGSIRGAVSKLGLEKDDGDGGFVNYYLLHDSYNKANVYIHVSSIYYGASNSDETEIKIKFEDADERFEYGAYLILSSYLK